MERILIIDDSVVQSQFLKSILEDEYVVEVCNYGLKSIEHAKQFRPMLILLDIIMPEISGFELLIRLKLQHELKDVPIILISGMSDVGHEEQGLKMGAVDYIVKPYSKEIVKARVKTHIRIYNLQRSMEEVMRMDPLTGVFNRRYLDERCELAWMCCMKNQQPFSMGMIDVDYFKKYNDTYGHLGGDAILRIVAQTAKGCLESSDENFVARYGGEEFLFVMPNMPLAPAKNMGDTICNGISALKITHKEAPEKILTLSIGGITKVPQIGETLQTWIERVDNLLYQAKNNGKNCVIWTDQL